MRLVPVFAVSAISLFCKDYFILKVVVTVDIRICLLAAAKVNRNNIVR